MLKNTKFLKVFFFLTILIRCMAANGQQMVTVGNPGEKLLFPDPESEFLDPPPSASPGVLWMWMGSNLSKEGITRDLEALKKEGFNRTTMFSLADITTPWAGQIGKSLHRN